MNTKPSWQKAFLKLSPDVALKRLELPYVYHIKNDELYELDDNAFDFLSRCDGSAKGAELTSDAEFVKYCVEEGLLELLSDPNPEKITIGYAPLPSLRYLELQLLDRCNLKCRHCYLGPSRKNELPLDDSLAIAQEFAAMGGLRLMISGGEPMLYPHLREFLERTKDLQLRRILLTNGILINKDNISWLNVEEIQFSLDGWRLGHDTLRGSGSFDKTMLGIHIARDNGIPISISTMVHAGNLNEFDELREFTEEISAIEWGIDVLCIAGSLKDNQELIVPYAEAVPFMKYAVGGGYHGSSDGFVCGRHLMTVMSTGKAVKCGFYEDSPLGDARRNLKDCWLSLKHIPLEQLECKGCYAIEECAGGCRFRAPHPLAPDPVMCALHGVQSLS